MDILFKEGKTLRAEGGWAESCLVVHHMTGKKGGGGGSKIFRKGNALFIAAKT